MSARQCDLLWFVSVLIRLYFERERLVQQQASYNEGLSGAATGTGVKGGGLNCGELKELGKRRRMSLINGVKLLCDLVFTCECGFLLFLYYG